MNDRVVIITGANNGIGLAMPQALLNYPGISGYASSKGAIEALTRTLAQQHQRPCLHANMSRWSVATAAHQIFQWIKHHHITVLNVAGPRASSDPRIYAVTGDVLKAVIKLYCLPA